MANAIYVNTLSTLENIGCFFSGKKRKVSLTVRQLCEAAGYDESNVSPEVCKVFDKKITMISRSGSRFAAGSVCCQLYNDDEHDIEWAMKHGAVICVSRKQYANYPCIVTENPQEVYSRMCELIRQKNPISATAIIGSIGKTTAKKMLFSVYRRYFKTCCDSGNDNQIDGVGYIFQHMPKKCNAWIQEVSEDTKGYVGDISRIIKPKITIITAIDKSHIEQYGDENGILQEIHSIVDYMPEDGICITSCDEDNTRELVKERKTIFVSLKNPDADFYADNITIDTDGLGFTIKEKSSGLSFDAKLPCVFAKHNVYSALYAFAAGVLSGIPYEKIIDGIKKYRANGNRQNIYKSRGITVYADCYNAVAKSVRSAVGACDLIPTSGKRVAVIGDVAETGDYAARIHSEIVQTVNDSKFNVLFAYGKNICEAVKRENIRDGLEVVCFEKRNSMNEALRKKLKKGDLVLFKASHSGGLENSLKRVFPIAYMKESLKYNLPQITWRIKTIFS